MGDYDPHALAGGPTVAPRERPLSDRGRPEKAGSLGDRLHHRRVVDGRPRPWLVAWLPAEKDRAVRSQGHPRRDEPPPLGPHGAVRLLRVEPPLRRPAHRRGARLRPRRVRQPQHPARWFALLHQRLPEVRRQEPVSEGQAPYLRGALGPDVGRRKGARASTSGAGLELPRCDRSRAVYRRAIRECDPHPGVAWGPPSRCCWGATKIDVPQDDA